MIRRVLFLCTGNSARSVLAESTLKKWGEGRYLSFSAGSQPAGRVNPFAIAQLQREGFPVDEMRSKSWDEFAEADSAAMDLIVKRRLQAFLDIPESAWDDRAGLKARLDPIAQID